MKTAFKPFPYQLEGARWLASRKVGLLADEMGLGKTSQAILAADAINAKRILVICPAIGRFNWLREFENISSEKRTLRVSTKSKDTWLPTESIVTSFEGACSVLSTGGSFDLMIIDEAHYLKNPTSARTRKILGRNGLVKYAGRIWSLTGTPAQNNYSELWPLLYTFGATKLSFSEFTEHFCETRITSYGTQIVGRKIANVPELKSIVSKVMKRRLKGEVMLELPGLFYSNFIVEPGKIEVLGKNGALIDFLNSENLKEKLALERKLIEEILKNRLGENELEALEAVANSVSTLRRYTGLQKVHEVCETIAIELQLKAYGKIVIFALHRDVISATTEKLKEFGSVSLFGGMTSIEQQAAVDRFQNDPTCRVIVANIRSAGTSITLTAASNVAFIETDWVPSSNAQAVMRCHRIGQKKSVFVRFFSLNTQIEERVAQVILRKTRDLAEIF